MIDLGALNKAWSTITKNHSCKTDAQTINFFYALQYGKNIVKDVSPEILSSMSNVDKMKNKYIICHDERCAGKSFWWNYCRKEFINGLREFPD